MEKKTPIESTMRDAKNRPVVEAGKNGDAVSENGDAVFENGNAVFQPSPTILKNKQLYKSIIY